MKSIHCIVAGLLTLLLIPSGNAFGTESGVWGEVSLTGLSSDLSGSKAKFEEYGDQADGGLFSKIRLGHENDKYYLKFDAENMFRDTEEYRIGGGMWGKFKYTLYYTEIPHNITYDARTFLTGAGSTQLTGTLIADDNTATWNTFDYSTLRKRYGAGIKLDLLKPFFVDFSVRREDTTGIKMGGGEGNVELPEPVDYRTDTVSIAAGYNKKPFFASVNYLYSEFDNDNQLLFSTINGTTRALTLPPNNHFQRLGFTGSVMLPMRSRFSTNIGIGRAKSEFDLADVAGVLSNETYHGRVDSKNYDFVLTSSPVPFADGKVYYKYYSTSNKSDETSQGTPNSLFSYKKNSYGAEAGFRLPQNLKLRASYKYAVIDFREKEAGVVGDRVDVDKRKDDTYGIDLIWTGLDFLTVKTGYERMNRRTDRPSFVGADPVEPYTGRYDVSPFNRDTFKLSADIMPVENLDLAVGYKYKKTDYKDTLLGLRNDKRNEFYADAYYSIGRIAKVFGYVDYEKVDYFQFQRTFQAANPDPSGVENASNYNWTIEHDEKNINYGIGTDIFAIPKKLTVTLQYDYVKSDGNADFTYLFAGAVPAGATNDSIDILNADDYRKKAFSVKAKYDISKPLSITLGYVYERYKYSDVHYDDFQYLLPGYTGIAFSGALAHSSYQANVIFMGLTYRF